MTKVPFSLKAWLAVCSSSAFPNTDIKEAELKSLLFDDGSVHKLKLLPTTWELKITIYTFYSLV